LAPNLRYHEVISVERLRVKFGKKKSSEDGWSGLQNPEYDLGYHLRWSCKTLYQQKLALISLTRGGRSVGIVRSLSKAKEFSLDDGLSLSPDLNAGLMKYSRLSIIRAWFNRFATQPRQCIFKETILFSVSITFV
jgi:hypothetical protein